VICLVQQHSALNTATFSDKLWPKNRVPYLLEPGLSDSERLAIAQAFEEYKAKTCVSFVPRQEHDEDFIYIRKNEDSGCHF